MKTLRYNILVLFVVTGIYSCQEDFLNTQPLDQFSEDVVWTDLALVETFVNNIYYSIPHGFSNMMMASVCDEAMHNGNFGSSTVTKCLITPSDHSVFDINFWSGDRYRKMSWEHIYASIRSCNVFMEKIEEHSYDDMDLKNRLIGEVHLLRAYHYHNLVFMYGGVPIISKAYNLDDDFLAPRNSFKQCIDFISEECDKAQALLPVEYDAIDKGRATKGAALALKSRVLLYAASELYNNSTWAGNYAHYELIAYTDNEREQRWQAAKDAAKAVIDLGTYDLFKSNPSADESIADNYSNIFLQKETTEDIFVRHFTKNSTENWDSYNPGLYNNPNGYHGWGSNTPIGQLVDDYEMADGSKFDWDNPEHAASPFENREPRFYATILYEGAKWRQRPDDVYASDPEGIIQVGYWEKWDTSSQSIVEIPGLDTRDGPIEDWNGTYSGYYLRKFIDPTVDAQFTAQELPWRFIRYAEVLLNYAEACIELGIDSEALLYLNMIRKRAGLSSISESGDALRQRCRHERRIELAYEDHRFFDIRRWMIGAQSHENARGVAVRYTLNEDKSTSKTPTFTVIDILEREWKDRAYFFPIKLDEINKNTELVQNPLY